MLDIRPRMEYPFTCLYVLISRRPPHDYGADRESIGVPYGFGKHLENIELSPEKSLTNSLLFCYLAELFYAASLALSQFAVLGFYWRMFRTSGIKVPILTLLAATTIWLILRVSPPIRMIACRVVTSADIILDTARNFP